MKPHHRMRPAILIGVLAFMNLVMGGARVGATEGDLWEINGLVTKEVTGEPLIRILIVLIDGATGEPVPEGDHFALTFANEPGVIYVAALTGGEFLVCVGSPGYRSECWNDNPFEGTAYAGDFVALQPGDIINDFDFALQPITASGDELPTTGSGFLRWAVVGALLLGLGAFLVSPSADLGLPDLDDMSDND